MALILEPTAARQPVSSPVVRYLSPMHLLLLPLVRLSNAGIGPDILTFYLLGIVGLVDQVLTPIHVLLLPLVWRFPLRKGSMGAAWR